MKRNMMVALLSLVVAFSAVAQTPAEEFARSLAAKSKEIETINCRFEQTRSMQILASDVVKQGSFSYLRPEQILLAFDDGDYIAMTPARFSISTGGVQQRVRVENNPMLKELKRILSASMTGDVEQLSAGFTTSVEATDSHYIVTLRPMRGRMSARISAIVMHFEQKSMTLSLLRMEEKSGDFTAYRFYQKEFNQPISPDRFTAR